MTDMKIRIMEELGEQVPKTTTFMIGYFEGQKSTNKRWIFNDSDVVAMYDKCADNSKEIILWCETDEEDREPPRKKPRKSDDSSNGKETIQTKRQDRVVDIAEELKEKHGDELEISEAQFRLWARLYVARLYVSGVHCSLDKPPNVTPKRAKRMSIEEAIASTAQSFAQAVTGKASKRSANTYSH